MALRLDVVPDVFELPVGADEESAADNAEKRVAEKFLHAARPVGFDRS